MLPNLHKQAGVLLHISSLPSASLGEDAFRFVDTLSLWGCRVWQTLPVTMPHDDLSPYQALSAHAGNPAFISLQTLEQQAWWQDGALPTLDLARLWQQFDSHADSNTKQDFNEFCQQYSSWLDDFALFITLRQVHHSQPWCDWPLALKTRQADAIQQAKSTYARNIQQQQFAQYLFFSQWQALRRYAQQHQIQLFGDVPLFVAYDSADVWCHPELFKLDAEQKMTVVAGVPPDYFSATGQRWGNPHYDWSAMQAQQFAWWQQRLHTQSALFDLLRIDHFRGLQAAWEIPVEASTAIEGEWQVAPGAALLSHLLDTFPTIQLIAEDLGVITPEVEQLKQQFHLPGMKILQFAFDGSTDNPHLPANISAQDVVYTGTHDNDTSLGWYRALDEVQQQNLHSAIQQHVGHTTLEQAGMPLSLIMLACATPAWLAIIPMQDILALDSAHRMNTPGQATGQWRWQFSWQQLSPECSAAFAQVLQHSGRRPA